MRLLPQSLFGRLMLVLASGFILATGAGAHGWIYATAMVSTVLASVTRLHPLWLIVAGAVVGALA